jgi:hypothetical protein
VRHRRPSVGEGALPNVPLLCGAMPLTQRARRRRISARADIDYVL